MQYLQLLVQYFVCFAFSAPLFCHWKSFQANTVSAHKAPILYWMTNVVNVKYAMRTSFFLFIRHILFNTNAHLHMVLLRSVQQKIKNRCCKRCIIFRVFFFLKPKIGQPNALVQKKGLFMALNLHNSVTMRYLAEKKRRCHQLGTDKCHHHYAHF